MAIFISYKITQRSAMEILATQLADLFSAVQQSDEKQIRRLLAINVSPNQQNRQGTTALMVATKIGNSKIIKMLHGAMQNKRPSAQLFCSQLVSTFSTAVSPTAFTSFLAVDLTESSVTPLVMSSTIARFNNVMPMSAMLPTLPADSIGLDDRPALSIEEWHTLYQEDAPTTVVYGGAGTVLEVEVLEKTELPETEPLEIQPPTEPIVDDPTTLLKAAICDNDLEAVKALLLAGASVQAENWYDTPLLVVAAETSNSNIVKVLLQSGANVNRGYDRLPLNVASECGNFEVVHMLMCAGAYLNATEESGYTALMCAAAAGHLRIVQTLVDGGANVNTNHHGQTPLMLAARNGHTKVYDFLYSCMQLQGLLASKSLQQQTILTALQGLLEVKSLQQQTANSSQLDHEMSSLIGSNPEIVRPL